MLEAAKSKLKEKWPLASATANSRFKELTQIILNIERDKLAGDITEDEAKELFKMHHNAVQTAFEELQGIGKLLAEAAINAAISAVRDIVNTAVGWPLL
jgi:hypothetical protein